MAAVIGSENNLNLKEVKLHISMMLLSAWKKTYTGSVIASASLADVLVTLSLSSLSLLMTWKTLIHFFVTQFSKKPSHILDLTWLVGGLDVKRHYHLYQINETRHNFVSEG